MTPVNGPCEKNERLKRFHFDSESGECRVFHWNGCGGNDVFFRNKQMCEKHCKGEYYKALNLIKALTQGQSIMHRRIGPTADPFCCNAVTALRYYLWYPAIFARAFPPDNFTPER